MSTRFENSQTTNSTQVNHLSQIDNALKALRKQERVCMFIDNSNLFHAIRNQSGSKKMDYFRLKEYLADGRNVDVRFYYSDPQQQVEDFDFFTEKKASRDRFYSFLHERLGFFMIRLPLRERSGYDAPTVALINYLHQQKVTDEEILKLTGQRPYWLRQILGMEKVAEEKGLDCEVVYDMAKLAVSGHYNTFILVAGDEDYARSVHKIREETGIRVELAFFGSGCSNILQKEVSSFTDFSVIPNLFRDSYVSTYE